MKLNWPELASLIQKKMETSAIFSSVCVFNALKDHYFISSLYSDAIYSRLKYLDLAYLE